MGVVYEAEDDVLRRHVALKFLPQEMALDAAAMERLRREARAASALNHPNICTVYDLEEVEGRPFIVMELLRGRTLRQLIGGGPLPLEQILELGGQIAAGLDAAHRQGMVHRDVKPANIFATELGVAKVLDFGLAKITPPSAASDDSEAPTAGPGEALTNPGATVGTAAYMSPEQIRGLALDARTDLFSFGAVLYEMATGVRPFHGSTTQELWSAILSATPQPASTLNPELPAELERVIEKSLEKDRDLRYQSGSEIRADLRRMQRLRDSGSASITRAAAGGPRATRWWRWLALVALVGVLLGAGILLGRRWRSGADRGPTESRRVAVLPFVNLGMAQDEFFVEGMTDEVRAALASIPSLQVIARASANQYRLSSKPPDQIGRELGVRYLLTGTIRWDREASPGQPRIRVTPELVELGSGSAPTTAWERSFDAEVSQAFDVQSRIATEVAQALGQSLAAPVHPGVGRATPRVEAHEAFLRGEELSRGGVVQDVATLRRAEESYLRAVAIDPDFALAWAQLSRVQNSIFVNGGAPGGEAEAALQAARKALALAPNLPEARLAVGNYHRHVTNDLGAAFQEYALALQAEPFNAEVLATLGAAEQNLGRWEDSLQHLERARVLDPRAANHARRLANSLLYLRRHADALKAANDGLALAPTSLILLLLKSAILAAQGDLKAARAVTMNPPAGVSPTDLAAFVATYWDLYWVLDPSQHALLIGAPAEKFGDSVYRDFVLAELYALRGERERLRQHAEAARRAFEARLRATPEDSELQGLLGVTLAYLGRRDEAIVHGQRALALLPPSKDAYYGPYRQHQLVRTYLLLGEREKALDLLEPLLRMPYHLSPAWLRIDPTFSPLMGDPRFKKLALGRN